jgi:hypothetical protein
MNYEYLRLAFFYFLLISKSSREITRPTSRRIFRNGVTGYFTDIFEVGRIYRGGRGGLSTTVVACLTDDRVKTIPSREMRSRVLTLTIAVLGGVFFALQAMAQKSGGLVFAPVTRPGPAVLSGPGRGFAHVRYSRRVLAGPGYWPYFYSDSEPETIEGPAPQVIAAPATPVAQPTKPAESVLLELQGDRWVRITNFGASTGTAPETDRVSPAANGIPALVSPRRTPSAEAVTGLPQAALVFRDGHTEEIRKYVIVGRTLYTTADYWSTGSWMRKVAIAELDVPATLKLNQGRGAKFSLPSGPTEVMMRP